MRTLKIKNWGLLALAALLAMPVVACATPRADYAALSQQLAAEGRAALEGNRLAEAQSLLQQSLLADPGSAPAFLLLAQVAHAKAEKQEALRLAELSLAIAPQEHDALFWAGRLALALDQTEKAEERLRQLKKLCKDCRKAKDLAEEIARGSAAFSATAPASR